VAGLAADGAWARLPLQGWLHEGGLEFEAVAACATNACSPRLAVAVMAAEGVQAERLRDALRNPAALAEALRAADAADRGPRQAIRVRARAEPWREDGRPGFTLSLSRRDGGRAVEAAVLGEETGGRWRAVLVVGENPDQVRAAARSVAAAHLRESATR
jgi:hypothetical protein